MADPEALEPLHLVELMDGAADTLGRVDRAAFFAAFGDTQAVQYFYEPFLEYCDPELGVAGGLAVSNVWVLDPCCGTGSLRVAVLDRVRRTLEGRGLGDLVDGELSGATSPRWYGSAGSVAIRCSRIGFPAATPPSSTAR